jgi:hypothetical protein
MSFYMPVQNARAFRREKPYDKVNWNNFREVLDEFHGRMDYWYILPAKELGKNGHFVFPVMAINCLLIDTLSQYYYGKDLSPTEQKKPENKRKNPIGSGSLESCGAKFKDFLVARLKHRTGVLPTKITTARGDLLTYEDVLWSGFRCGILHEAHIPLYGAIYGVENVLDFQPTGFTKYADGTDCPTVICFPQRLLDELETAFIEYIGDLLNPTPAFDDLRRRFKTKFEDSFGVTISTTI